MKRLGAVLAAAVLSLGAAAAPSLAKEPGPTGAKVSHAVEHAGIRAGQFCKKSDVGRVARATNGRKVRCTLEAGGRRARWRYV